MPPRILLINDTSDHDNWGSQACAAGLKQIIRAAHPDAAMTSIPSRWVGRKYAFDPHVHGRRLFNKDTVLHRMLLKKHLVLPRVADEFELIADLWQSGRGGKGADEYLRLLAEADIVVFNAEGSTYRNNYSCLKSLFMLWFARECLNKRAFFLNGSVTLTDVDPILPAMLTRVFDVLDGVTVREPNSLRMARERAPGATVEMVPDSVFHFGPDTADESEAVQSLTRDLEGCYFCFSLSMLPMDLQRDHAPSATLAAIKELQTVSPNVVLMAKDYDDQYLKQVASATGARFFGAERSYCELMALLKGADFLLSGRYHHIIMGTIMGCPSIPLSSTSPKVEGLCELLGEDVISKPFDPTWIKPARGKIKAEAQRLTDAAGTVRQTCRARAAALRETVDRMGSIISG